MSARWRMSFLRYDWTSSGLMSSHRHSRRCGSISQAAGFLKAGDVVEIEIERLGCFEIPW